MGERLEIEFSRAEGSMTTSESHRFFESLSSHVLIEFYVDILEVQITPTATDISKLFKL